MNQPNFNNLLKVLNNEVPDEPTLFEFALNMRLYKKLAEEKYHDYEDELGRMKFLVNAFLNAGYDFATVRITDFGIADFELAEGKSISQYEHSQIHDRQSFENYEWSDPDEGSYHVYTEINDFLPEGAKLVVPGPGGVLENVIQLVSYEKLSLLIYDDPELVQEIFDAVGSRLLAYYRKCLNYDAVGAIISNDDWGFKTQTLLSPRDMRKYIFPWHKKIAEAAHDAGKPAILHSCGNLINIMDVIIDELNYDGKHSFEDEIMPVEEAYERWGDRIAILGGLDLNFVAESEPGQITDRALNMLEKSADKGGYALGTGNSVPDYIPDENYFAMLDAIKIFKGNK
jgi:uroporphyrinogen decarboxylase